MSDGTGLAEALLGLPGFRVLEVNETHRRVRGRGRDDGDGDVAARACGMRAQAQDRLPVDDPRSAVLRSAGPAGVAQAAVAVPRARV